MGATKIAYTFSSRIEPWTVPASNVWKIEFTFLQFTKNYNWQPIATNGDQVFWQALQSDAFEQYSNIHNIECWAQIQGRIYAILFLSSAHAKIDWINKPAVLVLWFFFKPCWDLCIKSISFLNSQDIKV